MTDVIEEDLKSVCKALNKLFTYLNDEDTPNKTEIAMEWILCISQADSKFCGIMWDGMRNMFVTSLFDD
jgi:hypothetical protein